MTCGRLLVLAPSWPSLDSGYAIAIRSSLKFFESKYESIEFVGLTVEAPPDHIRRWAGTTSFHHVRVRQRPQWLRFLKSVYRRTPAVSARFATAEVQGSLINLIRTLQSEQPFNEVTIEDVPIGHLIGPLRDVLAGRPQLVLRSHNVLGEAFNMFTVGGSLGARLAWQHEVKKIRLFERWVLKSVDRVLAISDRDREVYQELYGVDCDGVLGVAIDIDRYASLKPGNPGTIVTVGSADLRKGHGLRLFIAECWPELKARYPRLRLVLAGRNTEQFRNADLGIEGIGYVSDDRQVLSRGGIFVNTQLAGSGIKLKSLVAMASGRVLVSTPKGVEGIAGVSGKHFLVCSSNAEMIQAISELIEDPKQAEIISENGRCLVAEEYSMKADIFRPVDL